MDDSDGNSVLLVHHRDLSSPIGTTLSYYLAHELAESHTVHVVCRKQRNERSDGAPDSEAVLHDLDTGDVPLVSTLAFHLLASLYVAVLAATHRFDVAYCFQSSMIQGWIGARVGGSRFVVGLASVPVRQSRDFSDASGTDAGRRERLAMVLLDRYATVVGHLLERATAVVCLTEGIRDVTREFYDVDLPDAHVVGMGVDLETFSRPRASTDGGWTVTYVGSVNEPRNLERVLEAMAALDHDVRFRIAGEGPDDYENALAAEAERLGVAGQVEWLGLVPHEEIPELLRSTDVAVSPLADIESYRISFPAKLLEYMAAGSVVVASDIPPHRRLIDDGENGFLYDGSRDELVATLRRCIEDERPLDDVRRRARTTAAHHDWDRVVRRHEAAMFDAVERDDPTRPAAA